MAARTSAARRVATYLVLMTRQWANQYAKRDMLLIHSM